MYRIGFDIGSTTIKAVVLDEENHICYKNPLHLRLVDQVLLDCVNNRVYLLSKKYLPVLWPLKNYILRRIVPSN